LEIQPTELPGILTIQPVLRKDNRGWFMETFNAAAFAKHGLPIEFPQDNHSSSRHGVIRGLHYQFDPPQGKLVRCVRGRVYDVAVDIRRGSPTLGKWIARELSEENQLMLWVPAGFAHGFAALTDNAEVAYKCTALWNANGEGTIVWNDPAIGIPWPIETPLVSPKDAAGAPLGEGVTFAP